MTACGPTQPTLADLAAATAATQAAIDQGASVLAVERAAEAEQATFAAWRHAPGLDHASPDLEAGA